MLPKYYKTQLKNKLEIYFVPLNKGSNVINVDVFYKVGSRDETLGKTGMAHMLEHLNFKSTKNHKAGDFDKIVKGFGGTNNASTGFDYTHYYIKASKDNLDKSLELFADMMENLSLKNSEFEPERKVVVQERRWRTDNDPYGTLYFKLFESAFSYHSYHWLPIGYYEDIINWKIADIRKFWKTYYQPKNAFLIITGDTDKKTAFNLAKKHFANIPNRANLPKFHQIEPKQTGAKKLIIHKESAVDILAVAFKIPNFKHPDNVALNALSQYLSGGKSSILERELVDKKQLVNSINAFAMSLKDAGLFIFIAVCNPQISAKIVLKELNKIIKSCKKDLIDEEKLTKIKSALKADLVYSMSQASTVASIFGNYIASGDIKDFYELENKSKNLSAQELKKIAKKYFNKTQKSTIILKATNEK